MIRARDLIQSASGGWTSINSRLASRCSCRARAGFAVSNSPAAVVRSWASSRTIRIMSCSVNARRGHRSVPPGRGHLDRAGAVFVADRDGFGVVDGHRLPEITVDKPPNEKPATQANLSLAPLGGTGSEFRCLRYDAAIARVSSGVHALAMNESSSPITRRVNPLTAGFDSGHTA